MFPNYVVYSILVCNEIVMVEFDRPANLLFSKNFFTFSNCKI